MPSTWWAYEPGATWAEPNIGAAAELMRRVWEHPDDARAVGGRARHDLLERFSLGRTADFVEHRLEDLRAYGASAAPTSGHDARPAIVEASQMLADDVGAGLADRGAPPASLVRRVLRRALWPYLEDQRRVDTAVLEAVSSLQRSVDELERRVRRLEGSRSDTDADAATGRSIPR